MQDRLHQYIRRRSIYIRLVLFLFLLVFIYKNAAAKGQFPNFLSKATGPHIANQTLGFEKIYVLNLPSRSDRRDAIELMAAITDIKIDFSPAMKGEDVEEVALVFVCHLHFPTAWKV